MVRRLLLLVLLALPLTAAPTHYNDDTCDIGVLPAATLLLPFFEVDLNDPLGPVGETTLFTVVNVTNFEQIAHVTLWTDRGFPVFGFPVYLTGYDAQSINLYDVFVRGVIAPDSATTSTRHGNYSDRSTTINTAGCTRIPPMDLATFARLRRAFTEGVIEGECSTVGGRHARATGYATIDVVRSCDATLPSEAAYWTGKIGYDNVLTGDYQQVTSRENFAQGGPLVHIRAVPEGGTFEQRRINRTKYDAGFQRTFYARYQSKEFPGADGRQPLPSRFAARWINGSTLKFQTNLKIWREGNAGPQARCSEYARDGAVETTDIVMFDENENATAIRDSALPLASMTSVSNPRFYPQAANGATSGWMYLNLDPDWRDASASMNWVLVSMRAQGRFSADMDAIAFGNGCSPAKRPVNASSTFGPPIAPSRDDNPGTGIVSTDNDDSCDVALLPAATLLLPYFEVDLDDGQRENTLLTVTNVTAKDQIARVTLWTDYSYPVLTFSVYLTGYDVQSISLFDVLGGGVIPANGTSVTARGLRSDTNAALDLAGSAASAERSTPRRSPPSTTPSPSAPPAASVRPHPATRSGTCTIAPSATRPSTS
ncbi:MAG TPA: hypothetical protein VNI54_04250 [Thermoanaerobaculia bacterium]|nr:hypothetical protein [Thermoanaerobaculia bacterium]